METRAKTRSGKFPGTARFEPVGKLGAGGMGIVYRALDRDRNIEVALKTLTNVSAATIFRFKQEFRALADVAHPNLVSLHELFNEDGKWFFTMELLDGVDLLTHVCGRPVGDHTDGDPSTGLDTIDHGSSGARGAEPVLVEKPLRGPPLVGRLREALPQLVSGVMALHASGHLHQDIKPSNIMVTTGGRVVLLDFGVVAHVGAPRFEGAEGSQSEAAGTPAYMAPEQSMAVPATPASDWYGIGVVLYHALAGRLPFIGTPERMLWDKAHAQPAPVRLSRPEVAEDLDRLCMDLLRPEPEQRPSGAEILRRLGAPASSERRRRASLPMPMLGTDDVVLVGREPHLAALREAFARTRRGAGATVLVHGTSGMGKSALVRAFLDEVRAQPGAVVLAGRCYERESVPYKAVDTVIDALCRHLLALGEPERAALVPADAALLATLFPVLRQIDELAGEVDPELVKQPHRLRRRAFAALRALFTKLARQPLVVFIDDLQWGDADSARLLAAVMQAPDAPAMMLLGCYRSDEVHRSALLEELAKLGIGGAGSRLAVEGLPPEQAQAVATELLRGAGADIDQAQAIAAESGGNPFFLHELVRYVAQHDTARAAAPSLEALLCARVDRLGDDVRRLVELLAVAGRPLEQRVAMTAARIAEADWPALVQRAGTARVVRVSGRRVDDLIECYHDRIREALVDRVPPAELPRRHNALGVALLDSYRRDPEIVAQHFAAAGDPALAARYSLQAADLATSTLAFDRAAALYRRTLDQHAATEIDELAVRLRLAAALVNAGRGAEAARIFLEAAATADGAQAVELKRLAAEQLLRSGFVDDGVAVLRDVLAAVGMSLPRSAPRSIPSLLWRRLRLRLRGLTPSKPRAGGVDRTRLDVCRTATLGLALFDPVRSATFSTRHLHLALDSGDPHRIAFALGVEASYMASARNPVRANRLLAEADAIAARLGNPELHGCIGMSRAIIAHERGDWQLSFDACERTEVLLRDQLTGVAWELRTLQMYSVHNMFFLGDYRGLEARAAACVADARERGDLYAIMNLRPVAVGCSHMVVHDDVAATRAELAEVERELPGSGFYVQHVFLLYAHSLVDLYDGEPERAHRRLLDTMPALRGSMLLHDRSLKFFITFLVAGSALAAAIRNPPDRARLIKIGERGARVIERDGSTIFGGFARNLRAAVALASGDAAAAADHLAAAAEIFDAGHVKLFAAASRRRLGQVIGGDRGAELIAQADDQARATGIGNPIRAARCATPGFPDR